MAFCLPLEETKKFIEALKTGEINPAQLAEMSSLERRTFLSKFVGELDAAEVNALFESKLLLKNQQQGMITWAEKVAGIKPEARRGIVEKINKLENVLSAEDEIAFLEDLASKRMGTEVKYEDAQKLVEMAQKTEELKAKIPEDAPLRSKERMEYGLQDYLLKEYVSELKVRDTRPISKKIQEIVTSPKQAFFKLAGITKSLVASMDNSFFGRQGIKVLYTNPDIWAKAFAKSWGDIARELKGIDAVAPIKADIYSRPNALNGKYTKSELAIGIRGEEAFPSSLPSRIPILGRLFEASESAYNGAALRMRADLFDRLVSKAERLGVDTTNPAELKGIGNLTNSMTGRGNIGRLEVIGNEINAAVFSIKFLKANIDTLTAHQFDTSLTKFARQEAALNTLKIVGTTAAVLTTARMFLGEDAVNLDPSSSDFGKIKVGDTRFDVTGGMASIVTLAARLVPVKHNGKWGNWKNGEFTEYGSIKYGQPTPLDALYSFGENKSSPFFRIFIDQMKQKDSDFETPTVKKQAEKLVTPIFIQNFEDLQNNPNSANKVLTTILDALGISSTTYPSK